MNEMAVGSFAGTTEMLDDSGMMIVNLTSAKTSYCSYVAETEEQKATLFKVMNNPEKRVADCINEVISVKDVYCEVVECKNKETGEITKCPRIVLIDSDGNGYQAVSRGVFGALSKLFQVYGEPHTWEHPIDLKVKQISKDTNKILTFEVVASSKKK